MASSFCPLPPDLASKARFPTGCPIIFLDDSSNTEHSDHMRQWKRGRVTEVGIDFQNAAQGVCYKVMARNGEEKESTRIVSENTIVFAPRSPVWVSLASSSTDRTRTKHKGIVLQSSHDKDDHATTTTTTITTCQVQYTIMIPGNILCNIAPNDIEYRRTTTKEMEQPQEEQPTQTGNGETQETHTQETPSRFTTTEQTSEAEQQRDPNKVLSNNQLEQVQTATICMEDVNDVENEEDTRQCDQADDAESVAMVDSLKERKDEEKGFRRMATSATMHTSAREPESDDDRTADIDTSSTRQSASTHPLRPYNHRIPVLRDEHETLSTSASMDSTPSSNTVSSTYETMAAFPLRSSTTTGKSTLVPADTSASMAQTSTKPSSSSKYKAMETSHYPAAYTNAPRTSSADASTAPTTIHRVVSESSAEQTRGYSSSSHNNNNDHPDHGSTSVPTNAGTTTCTTRTVVYNPQPNPFRQIHRGTHHRLGGVVKTVKCRHEMTAEEEDLLNRICLRYHIHGMCNRGNLCRWGNSHRNLTENEAHWIENALCSAITPHGPIRSRQSQRRTTPQSTSAQLSSGSRRVSAAGAGFATSPRKKARDDGIEVKSRVPIKKRRVTLEEPPKASVTSTSTSTSTVDRALSRSSSTRYFLPVLDFGTAFFEQVFARKGERVGETYGCELTLEGSALRQKEASAHAKRPDLFVRIVGETSKFSACKTALKKIFIHGLDSKLQIFLLFRLSMINKKSDNRIVMIKDPSSLGWGSSSDTQFITIVKIKSNHGLDRIWQEQEALECAFSRCKLAVFHRCKTFSNVKPFVCISGANAHDVHKCQRGVEICLHRRHT
ncbi:expressed unknown protein [Seminavis robusta]|uniref:Uncharacterized protein n=1 Tax=Seminavis robusta TaxID=568900 RepID=A0A9N8E6G2_9STRA|nr:expressed unknown protein [Seminavis robusta]|eukprot:Sro594_g172450.1 n/a (836) ;mRNA; r:24037-26544